MQNNCFLKKKETKKGIEPDAVVFRLADTVILTGSDIVQAHRGNCQAVQSYEYAYYNKRLEERAVARHEYRLLRRYEQEDAVDDTLQNIHVFDPGQRLHFRRHCALLLRSSLPLFFIPRILQSNGFMLQLATELVASTNPPFFTFFTLYQTNIFLQVSKTYQNTIFSFKSFTNSKFVHNFYFFTFEDKSKQNYLDKFVFIRGKKREWFQDSLMNL